MPTGTPTDLPTATLSYAAADTQWTLPAWIRTGLLVGVWLSLTAMLLQIALQFWTFGPAALTDAFRQLLDDPANWGQALMLLVLPLAWIVSASAVVAGVHVIRLTVVTGCVCVAISILNAATSSVAYWTYWQTLPPDEQTPAYLIAMVSWVLQNLPLGAAGMLLLFARPRFRIAERATQRFQRIVGGAVLILLVITAALLISYFDSHIRDLDTLAKPWRTLMQALWLVLSAAMIWLAVLIPMGLVLGRPIWTRAAQLLCATAAIAFVQVIVIRIDGFQTSLDALIYQLSTFIQDLTLAFALYAAGKLGTPIAQTPRPPAPELSRSDTPSGAEPTS